MKQLFNKFFQIRAGEWGLTILMFLNVYTILVTYYLLKPARDSLFLVKLGSEQLPVVFILIAIVVVPVTTMYSRAGRVLKLHQLINATTGVLIINLLILRWLITLESSWVYYLFYIWVSIYGVLSTSQFWLQANSLFDPSQAKRLFVLLNLGAIVGAFTGGEVTNLLVKQLGVATEDLLFVCMGLLGVTMVLANLSRRLNQRVSEQQFELPPRRSRQPRKESMAQIFRTVTGSRYLLIIVGVIAMTMATGTFVDYQFKDVCVSAFPEKADLTSFLGKFYGRLSLVSLFLQLLLAQRFIKWLGVGGIIFLLPMGLLAGTTFMLAAPGLLAGVLLRGADGSLKYSLDKTGRELLFLPVPLEVKKRVKIFIDMFVDRWFRGVAGAVLLLFTTVLGFSVQQISGVVLLLLIAWLGIAFLARKEYVNAFRQALQRRRINLDELTTTIDDPATVDVLKSSLGSDNDRTVAYALDMMQSVKSLPSCTEVESLLDHASADIRRKALQVLVSHGLHEHLTAVEPLLKDSDPEVRLEAMHYFYRSSGEHHNACIQGYIRHEDYSLRAAVILTVALHGTSHEKTMIDADNIEEILDSADSICKVQLAQALGALNEKQFHHYLRQLLEDADAAVVCRAIESAGRTRNREFVPALLQKLEDSCYRHDARDALAMFKTRITGTLNDHLVDDSVSYIVRRTIPSILARIATQQSVDILTARLNELDATLRYEVVKALSKLRSHHGDLHFHSRHIDQSLIEESRTYYSIVQIMAIPARQSASPADKLLQRALTESLDRNLEKMFRILGLQYPPRDIYNAYQGIVSGRQGLRANALEFLDNVLGKDQKKFLLPILDTAEDEGPGAVGERLFGVNLQTRSEALAYLVAGGDHWLKACALYTLVEAPEPDLQSAVEAAMQSPDPIVRETAGLVRSKL
jgi:ATP:ADP antiporter, AAA family